MGKVTKKIKRMTPEEHSFTVAYNDRRDWLIRMSYRDNLERWDTRFHRGKNLFPYQLGENLAIFRFLYKRSWWFRLTWWIRPPQVKLGTQPWQS